MAVTTMELLELLRKVDGGDIDFLREGVGVLAQALMDAEVSAQIGAEHGQRTPTRATHRNGYRARDWDTRVGTIDLQIPRVREGSYPPSFLEPRRRVERALAAVVAQCYVEGVSTRRVEDIAQAMGITSLSKSQVSRVCAELDELVAAWRNRPLDAGPYVFVGWMRWSSRSARRAAWSTPPRWSPPVSTPTGTARSSAWSWPPPRTVPPGRASCGAGRPRPVRGQAGGL
jgi:putative transposase